MKKLFALLLACAMLLSVAMAATEPVEEYPNTTYTALETKTAIVIDGVMDDAYAAAEVVKIESKIMVDLLYDESEIAVGEMDSVWFGTDASEDLSVTNCYAVSRCGTGYNKMNGESPDLVYAVKNMKDGAEVPMGTYGNAAGNYPENAPKPEGEVDSYVIEVKIPYTGAVAGGQGWFGAFLCDDVDFANTDVINLVDGRARTSEAVSTPNDNGIWNVTGPLEEGKVPDAREFFDVLVFQGAE